MFASFLYDAMAGLGCLVTALGLAAVLGFLIALRMGMLPGISAKLKALQGENREVPPYARD